MNPDFSLLSFLQQMLNTGSIVAIIMTILFGGLGLVILILAAIENSQKLARFGFFLLGLAVVFTFLGDYIVVIIIVLGILALTCSIIWFFGKNVILAIRKQ